MGRSGTKGELGEKGERGPKGPTGKLGSKGEPGEIHQNQNLSMTVTFSSIQKSRFQLQQIVALLLLVLLL